MAAAKKPKAGTAVVAWQEQMAEAAKAQSAVEKINGGFASVKTRGGILSVDDTPLKNNELRCVILMSMHENQYYEGAFNADDIQIPKCYAFSEPDGSGEGLMPHEQSEEIQEPNGCDGCWANEMGSADTGRGKACKNIRRLALVTADAAESGEAMNEAEVRSLKVPVTSVKNFSKFVHRISEEMQRPTWGVVCLVSLVPDAKTQFKMLFEFESLIDFDQDIMDAVQRKRGELSKEMGQPYQQPEEKPAKKVSSKKPVKTAKPAARQSAVTPKRKVGKF